MSDAAVAPASEPRGGLHHTVDDENIAILVERFYAAVQKHPTLGPVFNPRLEGRWDRHMSQMKDFWSSVLLRSGRYSGYPLGAHFGVPGMAPERFDDWLVLFRQTLDQLYEPPYADAIHTMAQQFAQRFTGALFGQER